MLNEALNVVSALEFETIGDVVMLKELMQDGDRALVIGHTDEERIVRLAETLRDEPLRAGDSLLLEPRSGYVYERIPSPRSRSSCSRSSRHRLQRHRWSRGADRPDPRRDRLPYLHPDLFREHQLRPPKGVLLYGPPGCGKTLIAKAVANSLAKKVAARTESPRRRATSSTSRARSCSTSTSARRSATSGWCSSGREKASEGTPVIVFFDEMDSLFRTRGSGVSSDVENTIVPQLLSEIDGVEGLENVIVIGASNREDMIDPAILRPGRLDVKIKIERPDAEAARDIFTKYVRSSCRCTRRTSPRTVETERQPSQR